MYKTVGHAQQPNLVSNLFLLFCLSAIFRVMGFSVMARVLNSPNGEGVADAVVTLNNQIKGNCDDTLEINMIRHNRVYPNYSTIHA